MYYLSWRRLALMLIVWGVILTGIWSGSVRAQGKVGSPHPEPARTKGWSWKLPPDLVTPDSGKRNHVFTVGESLAFHLDRAAVSYEVRDYWGNLVDKGAAGTGFTVRSQPPGWYKLYLYGSVSRPEWGDVVGGTTFAVFRKTLGALQTKFSPPTAAVSRKASAVAGVSAAQFPELPSKETSGGVDIAKDEVMRGVTGMGPQRHSVEDAGKPDEAIQKLEQDIALDKRFYLPFDPARKRALLIAFPNGTKGKEEGVRKIVAHFKKDVRYWEPRNEPNGGAGGADFARLEMKPFYEAVKSVDPTLKVLGPGTVSIGPKLLLWIEEFLKADGARYIDAFSFHAYNNLNGDLWLARKSMDSLNALLKRYGVDKLEKWQTEQGYMAAIYGAYQPRLQGHWAMLQMMAYEQYGIPKEHNHLWYDKSHGYWDVPAWWENEDGGLNPVAPLIRVWSEELYGTNFARAYDFGEPGNRLVLGSLFVGNGKRVAAFMSAGSTDGQVTLKVRGGSSLHLVSAFGVQRNLPVKADITLLPVPELPVYVELAPGQTIEVVSTAWGPNLARGPGVNVSSSAPPEADPQKARDNAISKLINGEFENWFWDQKPTSIPWNAQNPRLPLQVEIKLPKPTAISRIVVYAAPPWQSQGTLLDYELQVEKGGTWVTLEHVQEPAKTFGVFTPTTRTTVDSFFSDRWIFQHHFQPVTTQKLRLLIHAATNGGGATRLVTEAGGQAWGEEVVLREVEIYGR
ncbi:MAG: hypothetical protein JWN14_978 [Chthonomonadales bacterium]|nr:hypothetical protein [Chthonomonadales bacterium]